jgi:hypothetical protein
MARPFRRTSVVAVVLLGAWIVISHAHQDPCHRLQSRLSDHKTYVCGDKGRCDQCPDRPTTLWWVCIRVFWVYFTRRRRKRLNSQTG